MRLIFGRAEHVVIWVGEDSDIQDGRLSVVFLVSVDWNRLEKDSEQEHSHDLSRASGKEPMVCRTSRERAGAFIKAHEEMSADSKSAPT